MERQRGWRERENKRGGGRGKREAGSGKREEGRGKREAGRGKRERGAPVMPRSPGMVQPRGHTISPFKILQPVSGSAHGSAATAAKLPESDGHTRDQSKSERDRAMPRKQHRRKQGGAARPNSRSPGYASLLLRVSCPPPPAPPASCSPSPPSFPSHSRKWFVWRRTRTRPAPAQASSPGPASPPLPRVVPSLLALAGRAPKFA